MAPPTCAMPASTMFRASGLEVKTLCLPETKTVACLPSAMAQTWICDEESSPTARSSSQQLSDSLTVPSTYNQEVRRSVSQDDSKGGGDY